MSIIEAPDYSKVKVNYTADMIEAGLPQPEKWKGLPVARSIGSEGFTFDTLVSDARKMIGFEVWEGDIPTAKLARPSDSFILREFALAHGDDNPLYTDPDYGANTRYGCQLMYPTLLHTVKYGMTHGVNSWGPYPVSTLVAGLWWNFYDVIRVNTRFIASMKLKEVLEKKGRTGRLALYITDDSFWDQREALIAGGGGTYICVGKSGEEAKVAEEATKKGEGMSKTMLYERPTYNYSEDEVKKIVDGVEGEVRLGATLRYWEDVNVGDKLPQVVKGPLRFRDITARGDHEGGGLSFYAPVTARPTKNPITG